MEGTGSAPPITESGLVRSRLLDVSDIDFDRLAALPDCVLRDSLARVLGQLAAVPDRYQAHQSSLSGQSEPVQARPVRPFE
ncbi:FxSxx-COOH cyclophane-containing RiPP peptide [Actinokineospora inagensis]|uniref:FxSxx-COOH cyclophane-containing RiPP peptide n=1 Tax=Actinokineospora inagensis TaxID=103730 RepID=UPI0003F8F9D2|nr:FxSxx-COOH cyclophane-containing RiPP peptide [Actinokineospora inagensis]